VKSNLICNPFTGCANAWLVSGTDFFNQARAFLFERGITIAKKKTTDQ